MKNDIKYSDICDINKIILEFNKIAKNTKHRNKIFDFNMFYVSNIIDIYNSLINKTYSHGKYNIFIIKESKERVIMSEKIKDKIVNHLVSDFILLPLIDKRLIPSNVATRKNKGSSYAIKYMKKSLMDCYLKYQSFYILKCDIHKYFYNIDHNILLSKLDKIILDKDIYNLIKNIISSTNNSSCYSYNYRFGKGLPIGNQTSQILAIFYLNDLDHFIKEKLHIKYYIRYMDDFILIDSSKDYLRFCFNEINKYLDSLLLKLNSKSKIIKFRDSFVFLGYKYLIKNNKLYILMSSKNKRKIKKDNYLNYGGYYKYIDINNYLFLLQYK